MLDADHLIELAQTLVNARGVGAPRQVVLRRAVSTAYYAVFHVPCGTIAETFVSAGVWKSRVLFYRSLDHGKTKDRCKKLGQKPLPNKEKIFFEAQAFGQELRDFANTFVQLQELRHQSDYDPDYRLTKALAQQCIDDASKAMADLNSAGDQERNKFLAYILFDIRS
ncbi:MAG: hypothetical protein WDN01_12805 [Rhizomicrobium sp.]